MKSYPKPEDVLADIGEKSVEAFALAVQRTREDLRLYRATFPQWVADHSERGLANWISDRLWAHLLVLADAIDDMEMVEKGVTREILVGLNYKFRVKRHDPEGQIASYPTQTYLDFVLQEDTQLALDGMEQTKLVAGYEWKKELRQIERAVVSLRDGQENVIWQEYFPEPPAEESTSIVQLEQPGPTKPWVKVPAEIGELIEERSEQE